MRPAGRVWLQVRACVCAFSVCAARAPTRTFSLSRTHSIDSKTNHGATPTKKPSRLLPDAERDSAALWLINSCTVKGPSQDAMSSAIAAAKARRIPLVVAGCVPQVCAWLHNFFVVVAAVVVVAGRDERRGRQGARRQRSSTRPSSSSTQPQK